MFFSGLQQNRFSGNFAVYLSSDTPKRREKNLPNKTTAFNSLRKPTYDQRMCMYPSTKNKKMSPKSGCISVNNKQYYKNIVTCVITKYIHFININST